MVESQQSETIQPILEYLGVIAFAVTGALVAGRNRMDISGVLVLGAIVSGTGNTLSIAMGSSFVLRVGPST